MLGHKRKMVEEMGHKTPWSQGAYLLDNSYVQGSLVF